MCFIRKEDKLIRKTVDTGKKIEVDIARRVEERGCG